MTFATFSKLIWLICLSSVILLSDVYAYQTIVVKNLTSPPILDGLIDDWSVKELVEIPLKNALAKGKSDVRSVFIMAGIYGDDFYIFAQWSDPMENKIHKPYVWEPSEERYIRGPQREDRFSIQFEMEGDYTTQWFSGKEFRADMWHWKSSRTNPSNIAQDKMTIISLVPMKKSYKTRADNGKILYLFRPSDAGDPIYISKRYSLKDKDLMPKYILT